MYPRNAASPPSVLIGEVVQISDGAVQTTGVSVRVKTGSGAWGAGAGTLACDTTSGVWEYTPTQAETNGDTIKIAIYKSACLGASATLVTTAEATAGTVKLGAAQTTDITGSLSGSVGSVTGNVGGSVASVTGNVGGNVVGSVASVTAGVTLANTAHGGAAATLTLQTLTVSNSAGNAVVFESTGGSGHGLCATGDNGGSGIVAIGGSTGKGLFAEGGATTGHGAYFRAHGADSYGALFLGGASGAAGAFFDSSSAGPGIAADITGDLTGNVSGSVGSVTGNVGGSVVGSVASVTGGINTGAGTITTLDALNTAQNAQHSTTQSAISGLNDPTAAAIADAVWDEATSGHATAGTTGKALTDILEDTNELQTNQGNWLTATGFSTHSAADVWSVATRVLTAATNITSDGSAITMSSSGVVGTVNLVNTTTTNTDMVSAAPSAASIADAVWDEATSGHTTAGTTGKALTDAGSAGDPWSTALPGAYGAGTAGYLVGTYVDAAISDTATAASVAALNDLSTADIDARLAAYDAPTNAEMVAAFTEIKGATWSSATDTLEAIRDRGDSAWITATGFSTLDAAGVRTAVGLSAANLDTQLADIPTVAEFNARTLAAADYFDPAADTVANVTTVGTVNALAANSVNASALASDAAAEIGNGFLATTLTKGTAGTIERAFWQILKAQAVTDGAVAGTPTTTTFDTTLTAATGVYNHQLILFTSGALAGESRPITTYTQASGVITLQEALTAAPSASDEFIILPVHVHPISEIQAGLATSSEISALNDLSAADVNTQVDVALADIHLDHLFATAYDPASKPGAADALLNELIGDDAGVSQFTANALELAPTGSGLDAAGVRAAVGLATANLDAQLSTITADTNELQTDWANGGRLDNLLDTAASAGAGSGARTVAVTVDDGTNPLQNAIVRMSEGANTYTLTTNASGQGTFNLDDATYTVAIYKAGYTFAGTTTVVSADATPTYSMTAVSISAPANPAMTTAYLNVYDISGALLANETFTYQQTTAPTGTGTSFEPDSGTATSDGNGLLQIAMYKGSYYDITRPSGPTATVEIPSDAGSTYELPNMI